jgi:sugar lactone lactonase YvrE
MILLLLGCPPAGVDTADTADRDTGPAPCTPAGGRICTIAGLDGLAALGQDDVPATESYLYLPQDIDLGPDGSVYLLDWNNHRIRRIDGDGVITTIAGSGLIGDGPEGDARAASFNHPTNLGFDLDGTMLVAAWHNSRVERIDLESLTLSFVAGDGTRSFAGDEGDAKLAKLDLPSSVAVDDDGTIYISDTANQRIRTVTSDGVIHTWAGDGTAGYAGDGEDVSRAELNNAKGQAAAPGGRLTVANGTLYVADTLNQRIRAVNLDTRIIQTVAGNGAPGFSGDGGAALEATLFSPTDVAVGPEGELYIADTENSCVRVVDGSGIIRTFAGICAEPDYTGDGGPADGARLQKPYGIAVDDAGNVYIADTYNNAIRVVWK